MPRRLSLLLKIKILDNWNTYSTSLSPPLFHSLSLPPSFSRSFSLALFFSLSLSLSLCLFISLSLWLVKRVCTPLQALFTGHTERERERDGHTLSVQKLWACSKHSSFSQSVSMRDYYINCLSSQFDKKNQPKSKRQVATLVWVKLVWILLFVKRVNVD